MSSQRSADGGTNRAGPVLVLGAPGPVADAVISVADREWGPGVVRFVPVAASGSAVLDAVQLGSALDGARAVVHLPDVTGAPSARSGSRMAVTALTRAVLTVCAARGVDHLVVVTSARVYGARADNPVPLTEDAPRRLDEPTGAAADLGAVEDLLDEARVTHPGLLITSVRPAVVVGGGADAEVVRHFEAPGLLVLRGGDPLWQFVHVEDLARAILLVLIDRLAPVVTVGAHGWLTQDEVELASGLHRIEVTPAMAVATAQRLYRIGRLNTPPSDLDFVRHPWVVGSQRLRAAGWAPVHDNQACLRVLVAGLRSSGVTAPVRTETALGAASAAVAMVAAAAILRRRRHRGGTG